MKKIIITIILLFSISICNSQDKATTLQTGHTYNKKLLKGENDKYKIKLNKDDFCRMVVMQMGVDVVVNVFGPSLNKIVRFDTPNGNNGPENIEFTADTDGNYYLEIYPLNDYSGMTDSAKNSYIEQNQGKYEIDSISVLSKEESNKKIAEEKLKRQKFIDALNLGFEIKTKNEKLPDNWRQWEKNINLTIDTLEKHSGKVSLLIECEKKNNGRWGAFHDSIPPVFRGNFIELRGFMKMENVTDGFAGLFMIIYGKEGVLQSENMMKQMIQGTQGWTQYSITLPLSENAKSIFIGSILTGTGKLWADDFQILIDGRDISEVEYFEPKKYKAEDDKEFDNGSEILSIDLTESIVNNLDVLGKVWGFLKYYHPVIAAGEYNWDYELFRVLPEILKSKNDEERNNVLSQWIDNLGKVQSEKLKMALSGELKLKPDLDWITNSTLGEKLTSQLVNIRDAKRINKNYYVALVPEVENPNFGNENSYRSMKYPDAGFRLLALYRYWNIIQYYFPDRHLIDENWNDVLKEFIPKFVNAADELEYKLTALSLIAIIHDTHANILGRDRDSTLLNYSGRYYSPLKITFVENKAVVTDYYDEILGEQSGLHTGDVIETINNKPVEEIIKEELPTTPASNYPTQLREIARTLLRSKDSVLTIGYERGNSKLTSQVQCFSSDKMDIYKYYQTKDTCFKLINSDIAYIFPGSIKNVYLPEIMPEVMKTKGLIIDLRCYPSESIIYSLSEYLLPDSVNFVKPSSGSIKTPGLFTIGECLKVGHKNENFYKGKVIIIINEVTQSQAEFTTMAFRTAPNATVIGSTTAGADGNVSIFSLPGRIMTVISGLGVYYPDGKETQRVGIVPDIVVKPTIKGISEGRDELLEKAIGIINGE